MTAATAAVAVAVAVAVEAVVAAAESGLPVHCHASRPSWAARYSTDSPQLLPLLLPVRLVLARLLLRYSHSRSQTISHQCKLTPIVNYMIYVRVSVA